MHLSQMIIFILSFIGAVAIALVQSYRLMKIGDVHKDTLSKLNKENDELTLLVKTQANIIALNQQSLDVYKKSHDIPVLTTEYYNLKAKGIVDTDPHMLEVIEQLRQLAPTK